MDSIRSISRRLELELQPKLKLNPEFSNTQVEFLTELLKLSPEISQKKESQKLLSQGEEPWSRVPLLQELKS